MYVGGQSSPFTRMGIALLCVVLLGIPPRRAAAQGGEGEPAASAPAFPPGVQPGDPPGFQNPSDRDDTPPPTPQASQIGEGLAGLAYLAGAVGTALALRALPSAFRRSGEAVGNLRNARHWREQSQALQAWVRRLETSHSQRLAELEQAYHRYETEWRRLAEHLEELSAHREPPDRREAALDRHLEKLLELPLLRRRTRIRETLGAAVAEWKQNRNPEPLNQWIDAHRSSDLLTTTKGKAWWRHYETLQRELSLDHWARSGTLHPLDRWLTRSAGFPFADLRPVAWTRRLDALRAAEQRAAESYVREVTHATRDVALALSPRALQPFLTAEAAGRQPGDFFLHEAGARSLIRTGSGLRQSASTICSRHLESLQGAARTAAQRASLPRQGWRLVWPSVPLTAGAAVGTKYTLEGLGHYLFGDRKR